MRATRRRRLSDELVRRRLAESQRGAAELVGAGRVLVSGAVADNSNRMVLMGEPLRVAAPAARFVSRGGEKLDYALSVFGVDPGKRVCADIGASTGGFTDCLLQRGATRVYAVDVGRGQMHGRLLRDTRVISMEGVNARLLDPAVFSPRPSLVVADLAFISLGMVIDSVMEAASRDADFILLVKPQFEAERGLVERGGLVTDRGVHESVLGDVAQSLLDSGLQLEALAVSPIRGRAGNIEFFGHWRRASDLRAKNDVIGLVSEVVSEAHDGHGREG